MLLKSEVNRCKMLVGRLCTVYCGWWPVNGGWILCARSNAAGGRKKENSILCARSGKCGGGREWLLLLSEVNR